MDGAVVGESEVAVAVVDALGVVLDVGVAGAEDGTDDGAADVGPDSTGAVTVTAVAGAPLVAGGWLAVVVAGGPGCWTSATGVFGEWLGAAELAATEAATRVAAGAGVDDSADGRPASCAPCASSSVRVADPAAGVETGLEAGSPTVPAFTPG